MSGSTSNESVIATLKPSILAGVGSLIVGFLLASIGTLFAKQIWRFFYEIYIGIYYGDPLFPLKESHVVIALWAICLIIPICKIIGLANTKFDITPRRVYYYHGVLNRRVDQLEIARIRDLSTSEPLLLRLFGLGNLILLTADRTHPQQLIPGIKDVHGMRERVHDLSVAERQRTGYQEMENTTEATA